ncbi:hypothetical protein APHWI1_0912 [Anaplasma phagocytophilum str. ApWI1]|uniref:Uncharacterized protein n=1 Tax=Anaplasma phagocytophilum str. ApWI1 TaxID=1359155 RepID=A0A0F3PXT8_ANAPH|nr:hypothetical protein APHHGE2_0144 [Anaplasma phagocytophilum str. HGE2]KJV85185.1 hypothetical protein APHWI1_0912 [Anaplasma phagocytophilum str. ApWI1]KJV86312.1 hypothetical protein APHNYW_1456 [Anaplasma phagocytophilum str. ApNYW]KJV99827.1 hypothetical protein OTSANNIE_0088 [Anaplasma phagocytophilum str. Annie]KJZ98464.1 hypothetical protein APHCR_0886 [Anaplasma phagocytophilum str. CR1007]KKA00681.1 hypothetical protein APHDU1_0677 [Anaplasma phagocytophilum]
MTTAYGALARYKLGVYAITFIIKTRPRVLEIVVVRKMKLIQYIY